MRINPFAVVFGLSLAALVAPVFGREAIREHAWAQPVATAAGAVVLVGLWAFVSMVRGEATFRGIFMGEDHRPSTSKFQFFLWTALVTYGFTSIFAARLLGGSQDALGDIPQTLLVAMGVSAGTTVAAKWITERQIARHQVAKTDSGRGGDSLTFLVSNDRGDTELTKVQVVAWTLVAGGVWLLLVWARIAHALGGGCLPSTPTQPSGCGLPDLDPVLLYLTGFGNITYLGTKAVSTAMPRISSVAPSAGDETTDISLLGAAFGTPAAGARMPAGALVTIDGTPAGVTPSTWTDTLVAFRLPATSPDGRPWRSLAEPCTLQLMLIVGGLASNAFPWVYQPHPAGGGATPVPARTARVAAPARLPVATDG